MHINHEWNNFMLKTINEKHAMAARHNCEWRWSIGNLYVSSNGDRHVCDQTCIRWVYRAQDKLKICAITGLCKNSISNAIHPSKEKLKRQACEDSSLAAPLCSPEDAIARADSGLAAPRALKRRSFRSEMSESGGMTDTDMDCEDAPFSPTAMGAQTFAPAFPLHTATDLSSTRTSAPFGGAAPDFRSAWTAQPGRCCGVNN